MAGTRAATRYAKAILEIAETNQNIANVNNDMLSIKNAIANNKELKDFISNPIIKGEVKRSALVEVFATAQNETKSLFQLLLSNKRFSLLEEIANQFQILFNQKSGIQEAVVTTAFPITPELEAKVMAKIASFSDKKIHLKNIVDPSIIGGFILRIEDKQYNASVANSLQELKREFSN